MTSEGVIKFRAEHHRVPLDSARFGDTCCKLLSWREILALTGLVGQQPKLYDGFGYGNVSARVGPPSKPRGQRAFLITGTQTSGLPHPTLGDFCVVNNYDIERNCLESQGSSLPSSESLTHAAVYDLGSQIRFVFHVHSPVLWHRAANLRIPQTDPKVAYGTPEMAKEVRRLYQSTALSEKQLFSMTGHEDGIVAFGHSAKEVGNVLLEHLALAYESTCRRTTFH